MFATLSRSWEYAKISYGVLWENKQLVIFPILSSIAAVIVMASFVVPLWSTGMFERLAEGEPEFELDERLAREKNFDPDIWIVEIEARDGRSRLDEDLF